MVATPPAVRPLMATRVSRAHRVPEMRVPLVLYARRMDLRQLRALVAVVDAGTFTDAAARLGVSQAAVSRSVAALETGLGARLLRRTTRRIELTPTGERVVAQARRV